ncbi:MAG: hypothetical protein ACM3NI_12400 [Bacteroidota bacterium]
MSDERGRIEFVLQRDGVASARARFDRTLRIYRQAVLNPHHHAHTLECRREFIQAYCAFKHWLTKQEAARHDQTF